MRTKPANHRQLSGRYAFILIFFCLAFFNTQAIPGYAQANIPAEQLDHFIQTKMEKNSLPGLAIAIASKDRILYAKGYGATSDQDAITADTPFAVASLSKSFTALAVMQLVETGRVDLDTPIARYIPEFKLADPRGAQITVRHLLNHTSGLTDTVYPDMTVKPQPASLQEVIKRLSSVQLHHNPGDQYHYNNTNYQLLARIVEEVSKEAFPDYLARHIFQPLGMSSTYDVSNTEQFRDRPVAKGHYLLFGQAIAASEPEWFVEGAAGMVSTANDMGKWLMTQLNDGAYRDVRLLSKEGIESMHAPSDAAPSYGMGWSVRQAEDGQRQIEHGGILWTYKSEALLLPEQELGIVILFNSGLNAFVDYYSFVSGIADIVSNRPLEDSWFNGDLGETCMGLILVAVIWMGIRDLLRLNRWEVKNRRRTKIRTVVYLILRLWPLYILLLLPNILTFIGGGRVLSLEGIFMMMPSMIVCLAAASLLSLIIVIIRVIRILRPRKATGTHYGES